jgi:hypothetical protein
VANFHLGRFTSGDQTDFSRRRIGLRPKVNDGKHRTVTCPINREPALLCRAVLQIGGGEEPRIVKDRGGKLEGDTVLVQISGGCLDFVPLKMILPFIQNRVSILCYSSCGGIGLRCQDVFPEDWPEVSARESSHRRRAPTHGRTNW